VQIIYHIISLDLSFLILILLWLHQINDLVESTDDCPEARQSRACERSVSGAENGAERAENGMSGSGAVSGC